MDYVFHSRDSHPVHSFKKCLNKLIDKKVLNSMMQAIESEVKELFLCLIGLLFPGILRRLLKTPAEFSLQEAALLFDKKPQAVISSTALVMGACLTFILLQILVCLVFVNKRPDQKSSNLFLAPLLIPNLLIC